MKFRESILEELEFSEGYCGKKYSDEKLGPGNYVHLKDHHNYEGYVFKAETFDQFAEACRAMVLIRFSYGWYPTKMEKEPEPPYTQEERDATPDKLMSFVHSEMKKWSGQCHGVHITNDFVEMCQLAISDHEYAGYAAVLIVERRQEHEDEDWFFQKLLDPYKYFAKIKKAADEKKAKTKLKLKSAA